MAEYKVIKVENHQVKNSNYVGEYAIVASMITQKEPDSILGTVNLDVENDMYIIAKNIEHASQVLNDYVVDMRNKASKLDLLDFKERVNQLFIKEKL